MKMVMMLTALGLASSFPEVAFGQAAAGKPAGTCSGLTNQWDSIEKDLAAREAEGFGDNSAPRATLRELENSNDLARAQMILSLMQSGRCALPESPPNYVVYITNALSCSTERLKGTKNPAECDRKTWKKLAR